MHDRGRFSSGMTACIIAMALSGCSYAVSGPKPLIEQDFVLGHKPQCAARWSAVTLDATAGVLTGVTAGAILWIDRDGSSEDFGLAFPIAIPFAIVAAFYVPAAVAGSRKATACNRLHQRYDSWLQGRGSQGNTMENPPEPLRPGPE